MKRAGIYRLKDRIFIHPWQSTEMGLGVATEPYVALPLDVDSAKLGQSLEKRSTNPIRPWALPPIGKH